ncbi:MAG: filamentous hemagglutinin N-terminal domain-containing protein, partial [Deltaproteobacteria bacterium]|nr:filamentous hemagglutinin N-terminal domain-containing protein [Deltaproteobacteria bacterium]
MKKKIFYYRQIFSIMFLALLIIANAAAADLVVSPESGATKVYSANNGVPVVDINTANQQGLSHNIFTEYNVGPEGLILNNANKDIMVRQSQLAGQIMANPNLNKEAKFILNEVKSQHRTSLEGFTEVLGGKADVIISNPFGITANGCGFLNTNAVVLSTGRPSFGPLPADYILEPLCCDAEELIALAYWYMYWPYDFSEGLPDNQDGGMLNGFKVSEGDILIEDKGINASETHILKLLARSVKIDGQVNAGDYISIIAGANDVLYSYKTGWMSKFHTAAGGVGPNAERLGFLNEYVGETPVAPMERGGKAPEYAIDSTVLGGLYAGGIRILSTENGVGVRMLGNAAATAENFVIRGNGKIEIQGELYNSVYENENYLPRQVQYEMEDDIGGIYIYATDEYSYPQKNQWVAPGMWG